MPWLRAAGMAGSQWSTSSLQLRTRPWLTASWAVCLFPLSDCACMFGMFVFQHFWTSRPWGGGGPFLPLLWGIFLPCSTGLVSTVNGKTWKQQEWRWMERGGEEMKGNPTTMRRNMLVECVCACMAWVLISFPKIPLPYNPEANSNSVRSISLCLFLSPCLSLSPLHLPMHCYTIV